MARKKPIATETSQQTADMTTETNRLIATRAESTPPALADDDFDFETTTSGEGVEPDHRAGEMPPADDDDFFSAESLAIVAQMAPAPASATLVIEERKPPKDQFIKICTKPGYCLTWPIIECASAAGSDDKVVYVVHPKLARQIESEPVLASSLKQARVMLYHVLGGNMYLWVVNQPIGEKESAMTIARNQAISFAEQNYVRITWDQHKKIHDAFVFKGQFHEPAWPEKTMPEIIKIAFGDARMIRTMEHPVLRRLAGLGV
jgi:hypothetical protein